MAQPLAADGFTFRAAPNSGHSGKKSMNEPFIFAASAEAWLRTEYRRTCCNWKGKQIIPFNLKDFEEGLKKKRPADEAIFKEALIKLDREISEEICKPFAVDETGAFEDPAAVILELYEKRPDLAQSMTVGQVVDEMEKQNKTAKQSQSAMSQEKPPPSKPEPLSTRTRSKTSTAIKQTAGAKKAASPAKSSPNKSIVKAAPQKTLTPEAYSEILTLAQLRLDKDKLDYGLGLSGIRNRAAVVRDLSKKRPDIQLKEIEKVVLKAAECQSNSKRQAMAQTSVGPSKPAMPPKTTKSAKADALEAWVHQQFLDHGFDKDVFKGFKCLKDHLIRLEPTKELTIRATVNKLRQPGHKYSFTIDEEFKAKVLASKTRKAQTAQKQLPQTQQPPNQQKASGSNLRAPMPASFPNTPPTTLLPSRPAQTPFPGDLAPTTNFSPPTNNNSAPKDDLLARKLNQLRVSDKPPSRTSTAQDNDSGIDVTLRHDTDDSDDQGIVLEQTNSPQHVEHDMSVLLADDSDDDDDDDDDEETDEDLAELRHAPLVADSLVSEETRHVLPQYGLIGAHQKSKLFLNTNIPFSAFICGVQGSGKSHTTSCILENSLIPSKSLGRLENPLSALVLSYGHFSGDGSGFSICEATFLAAPNPSLPGHPHVKKVNVLVSPSNYVRISKLYLRIPNVTVTPFKLKPWNLDIDIMLTLMNVSESDETPLYMAQVTQILREMATQGGAFNYGEFKQRLRKCRFNPTQINMLQMRLNLLESFLDMNNSCPEPQFRPGEITIMDMSCPFVDPNTACILFRIGLQRYLQSNTPGKMIVLDEAHKYMLNVPGAKALNETVLQTIRLQRHYGARVVVSTQEPTLLTGLIALCSITVIHRFSSPEWFAAIKQHIPIAAHDHQRLLQSIESLKTGTALVYSSNAVLGRDEDGDLVKGVGKMMKVSIRKRVTSDGGQSVLAV